MIIFKRFVNTFTLFLALFPLSSEAVQGKLDMGPAYVHVDSLFSNKTVGRRDLPGIRADGTILLWKGLCLKPAVLWTYADDNLFSAGIGAGFYVPVGSQVKIAPLAGVTYTRFATNVNIPIIPIPDVTQRFTSWAPYTGIEAIWEFAPTWRVCGTFQYAWANTKTTIDGIQPEASKGTSKGANYALMVEHDLNKCWSVNVAGGYNLSMSHEKHGIRAYGAKIGIARWF